MIIIFSFFKLRFWFSGLIFYLSALKHQTEANKINLVTQPVFLFVRKLSLGLYKG